MIDLEAAKSHLRVYDSNEDADITLKLTLAAAIVCEYIGFNSPVSVYYEKIADAATLLVLGELYANREASSDPLSPSVRLILERIRVPVLA